MPTANPPARVWCLRFKLNRATILLHVDAQQTFGSIRAELLAALQATHPSGIFKGTLRDGTPVEYPLPTTSEDIALAKPNDINDLNAGWETIGDFNEGLFFDEEFGSKGRGKGKQTAAVAAKHASARSVNDCPQGAGLRDGGAVAVRFRLADEKARRQRLMASWMLMRLRGTGWGLTIRRGMLLCRLWRRRMEMRIERCCFGGLYGHGL
jgi:hypothetical protein